ncbi:hypothetical protein COO60DRAFT_606338 [Scenedesmus sp. NREL 46B-D3]|nr:hypothetical protein COO60DRAFT_606338 [Scenedesmus sp. NREL 46B-D3]
MSDFYNRNDTPVLGRRCRTGSPRLSARFRSKVVYAFVHQSEDRGHKRYVGSVHGCGVTGNRCGYVRAKEHFQAAHSFVRTRGLPNADARSHTPFKLYEYMQTAGLQDLVMIPLQILSSDAPKRGSGAQGSGPGVEYVEQQWIDRCWLLHWGYNTRMAHSDPPVPFDTLNNSHCVGRLFGSRVLASTHTCHFLCL